MVSNELGASYNGQHNLVACANRTSLPDFEFYFGEAKVTMTYDYYSWTYFVSMTLHVFILESGTSRQYVLIKCFLKMRFSRMNASSLLIPDRPIFCSELFFSSKQRSSLIEITIEWGLGKSDEHNESFDYATTTSDTYNHCV